MPAAERRTAFLLTQFAVRAGSHRYAPTRCEETTKKTEGPMKKLVIALVALLPLAGAAQAQTVKDLLAAMLAKWNEPTEPFKIIGNVYYVGTNGLASYLITSPQGHILVDTV